MRRLPQIERAFVAIIIVMMVAMLALVMMWHLRWNAMLSVTAAMTPHPGVVMPAVVTVQADVQKDFAAWIDEGRRAMESERPKGPTFFLGGDFVMISNLDPGQNDLAGGLWSVDPRLRKFAESASTIPPLDPGLADRLSALLARGLRLGQLIQRSGVDPEVRERGREWTGVELCVRAAACWRSENARRSAPSSADGPGRWSNLDDLDAVSAAIGPDRRYGDCASLIGTIRDAAYLDAQLNGTLPAARLARWRADADSINPLLVDLEVSRRWRVPNRGCFFFGMMPWHYMYLHNAATSTLADRWHYLCTWWDFPDICARQSADLAHNIDDLIAHATSLSECEEISDSCLATLSRHRFAMIASTLAECWMRGDQTCNVYLGPSLIGAGLVVTRDDACTPPMTPR